MSPAPAVSRRQVTDRFVLLDQLGEGGSGLVYKAYDNERRSLVALKLLRLSDPQDLYRFKVEFRTLADLVHPNLVRLHELFAVRDQWFFTMELIEGEDFVTHARRELGTPEGAARPRLRAALRQLVEGLSALHATGKLHRDVKASNTLVTPSDRVVLLDFGLVTDIRESSQSRDGAIPGTPAYMSPEHAAGHPVTPASDWYGVGVVLYEALAGRRPFEGDAYEVLRRKQLSDPESPRAYGRDVPADLERLCLELLSRDPAARPGAARILERLRGARPGSVSPETSEPIEATLGRPRYLEALRTAYASSRAAGLVAYVHGSPGIGKTVLARHFLEEVAAGGALVLEGRCYEREYVPYQGLDGLVDALSRHLLAAPEAEVEALLDHDLQSLARAFPVLRRVPVVSRARRRLLGAAGPQEVRRLAIAALRGVLAELGQHRPVVLYIDDAQWADIDSAAVLTELLAEPDPPRVLLLISYRTEDASTSDALARLHAAYTVGPRALEVHVQPLDPDEGSELAAQLLGGDLPADLAATVARESGGNPFFLLQLASALGSGAALPRGEALTLEAVVASRVGQLPPVARDLLEVIAVAGRPIDPEVACRAAGSEADLAGTLDVLRTGRFIRTNRRAASGRRIEVYHDRIRELLVARQDAASLRVRHGRLAEELEASAEGDLEQLAQHLVAAGRNERAAEYAESAAGRAAESLAFDRAARLYRLALSLVPHGDAEALRLRAHLAQALTNAGRCADAGFEFQAAARLARGAEALELERRAAMELLLGGRLQEGLAAARSVLGAVGMRMPETPRRIVAELLLRRLRITLGGLGFRERAPGEVPESELARIDVCWSVAVGLAMFDVFRGAYFQARHLELALRAGEPHRVARALPPEAAFLAVTGGRAQVRALKLLDTARELATRLDDPHALGMAVTTTGMIAFMQGRFRNSVADCDDGEAIFRGRCTGVAWELTTSRLFAIWSLAYLGEIGEVVRRVERLIPEAQQRGDLYAAATLRTALTNLAWLARDDVEGARREARWALRRWAHQGFHYQHYRDLLAQTQIDLYAGDGPAAYERLAIALPEARRAMLLRIEITRIESVHMRGRAALATAASCSDPESRRRLARLAAADARRIERDGARWALGWAHLLRAGAARIQGDAAGALEWLGRAEEALDAVEMRLYAAAARREKGRLQGEPGRALAEEAEAWMRGQGIRNPRRMSAMLAPGFELGGPTS